MGRETLLRIQLSPRGEIGQRKRREARRGAVVIFLAVVALSAALAVRGLARSADKPLVFREDFSAGNLNAWQLPHPEDWEILSEGPLRYLHMKRSREPGVPRRPLQFALAKLGPVGSFTFEGRVRREGRSMIVVFGYVDTLHFYYAHLSMDRGSGDPVHNGIFLVDGGPRRRIAGLEAAPALPDRNWHALRLVRDVSSGRTQVFMDGQHAALFSVKDRAFPCGQVGVGSFDETGDWADIRITSQGAGCTPAAPSGSRPSRL